MKDSFDFVSLSLYQGTDLSLLITTFLVDRCRVCIRRYSREWREEEWDVMVVQMEVNQPQSRWWYHIGSIVVMIDLWNEYYSFSLCSCIVGFSSLSTRISIGGFGNDGMRVSSNETQHKLARYED